MNLHTGPAKGIGGIPTKGKTIQASNRMAFKHWRIRFLSRRMYLDPGSVIEMPHTTGVYPTHVAVVDIEWRDWTGTSIMGAVEDEPAEVAHSAWTQLTHNGDDDYRLLKGEGSSDLVLAYRWPYPVLIRSMQMKVTHPRCDWVYEASFNGIDWRVLRYESCRDLINGVIGTNIGSNSYTLVRDLF